MTGDERDTLPVIYHLPSNYCPDEAVCAAAHQPMIKTSVNHSPCAIWRRIPLWASCTTAVVGSLVVIIPQLSPGYEMGTWRCCKGRYSVAEWWEDWYEEEEEKGFLHKGDVLCVVSVLLSFFLREGKSFLDSFLGPCMSGGGVLRWILLGQASIVGGFAHHSNTLTTCVFVKKKSLF